MKKTVGACVHVQVQPVSQKWGKKERKTGGNWKERKTGGNWDGEVRVRGAALLSCGKQPAVLLSACFVVDRYS